MRRGYTLVELLLVMAVLMLIAGLVFTYRGTAIQARSLRRDGTALLSTLRKARAMAIGQGTRTKVLIDVTGNTASLEYLEDPLASLDQYTAVPGEWGRPVEFDEDTVVTATQRVEIIEVTEIIFHSDGTTEPVDIDLTHIKVQDTYRIRLDALTGLSSFNLLEETP